MLFELVKGVEERMGYTSCGWNTPRWTSLTDAAAKSEFSGIEIFGTAFQNTISDCRNYIATMIDPLYVVEANRFYNINTLAEWTGIPELLTEAGYGTAWDSESRTKTDAYTLIQLKDVLERLRYLRYTVTSSTDNSDGDGVGYYGDATWHASPQAAWDYMLTYYDTSTSAVPHTQRLFARTIISGTTFYNSFTLNYWKIALAWTAVAGRVRKFKLTFPVRHNNNAQPTWDLTDNLSNVFSHDVGVSASTQYKDHILPFDTLLGGGSYTLMLSYEPPTTTPMSSIPVNGSTRVIDLPSGYAFTELEVGTDLTYG